MNSIHELVFAGEESDERIAVRFPSVRSTGLLNLDYLQEEMLVAIEQGAYFAAITTASTLVELALRYYLILFDAIDSGTHPAELIAKWSKRTLNTLINDVAARGIDSETIHDLHDFRSTIRNSFVHGGIATFDHIFDSAEVSETLDLSDRGAFSRLLAFTFMGPLDFIMKSEATALFAVTFALRLCATVIPWEDLLKMIQMPVLSVGEREFYSPESGGVEVGKERNIRLTKGAVHAFHTRWTKSRDEK